MPVQVYPYTKKKHADLPIINNPCVLITVINKDTIFFKLPYLLLQCHHYEKVAI